MTDRLHCPLARSQGRQHNNYAAAGIGHWRVTSRVHETSFDAGWPARPGPARRQLMRGTKQSIASVRVRETNETSHWHSHGIRKKITNFYLLWPPPALRACAIQCAIAAAYRSRTTFQGHIHASSALSKQKIVNQASAHK